jgi:acyl carrier protein
MLERILAERLDIDADSISDEKNIVEDLGADSLSVVEIIMDIENEFDISIPDEDAEELHTVGQLKEYVENYA